MWRITRAFICKAFIWKAYDDKPEKRRFRRLRGIATLKMTTVEIMALTRQKA